MAETLKLQEELWLQKYGTPMTEAERQAVFEKMVCLQGLYFEDIESITLYSSKQYWEDISEGLLTVTLDSSQWKSKCTTFESLKATTEPTKPIESATAPKARLNSQGYVVLPGAIAPTHSIFSALKTTARRLTELGWPPAFLFLYDEVWELLIAPLFDVYTPLLGLDVWMESDLNCWRLKSPPPTAATRSTAIKGDSAPPPSYIGVNFGNSHRDMTYEACHDVATEAFHSLNCWVPINPSGATLTNGCMRVIPIEMDDYFYDSKHPYHMSTAKALSFMEDPKQCTVTLPALPGAVVTWTPSLVHWGGCCEAGEEDPRMSIAATFRKSGTKRSVYGEEKENEKEKESNGPPPIQLKDMGDVCFSRRLSYVAKSIISFAHWYPGLPGLSVERLQKLSIDYM